MNKEKSERIDYFDICKGIGIILVIIAHSPVLPIVHSFIYSFHMPLFFILGGVFFKVKPNDYSFWLSTARRLLFPYFLCCFVWFLYYLVFGDWILIKNIIYGAVFANSGDAYADTVIFSKLSKGIGVAWFFFALFWSRVILNLLSRIKNDFLLTSFVFALFIISLVGSRYILLPFAFWQGLQCLLFYYIGYCLSPLIKTKCEEIYNGCFTYNKLSVVLLFIIFLVWIDCIRGSMCILAYGYYGKWYLDILGSICGCFFIILISVLINRYSCFLKNFLKQVGTLSLIILVVHAIEFHFNIFQNYSSRTITSFIDSNNINDKMILYFTMPLRLAVDITIALLLSKVKYIKSLFV